MAKNKVFNTLIVEDNATFRKSLSEMLTERFDDMRVSEASDSREAQEIIASNTPDLILMDVRLPGESGLELTRRIKRDHQEITVIMLTNYDLEEYREAARNYGADFFMPKGTSSWEEIIKLVETVRSKA
ncbi:MAG: response regulator transcription factor [Syntrophaceae bacterium]|nr:response regulator transcription factor [Syntrophaceae bacterium]